MLIPFFYRAIITLGGDYMIDNDICESQIWIKRIQSQVSEMQSEIGENQIVSAYYKGVRVQYIGYSSPDMIILFCPNLTGPCNRIILSVKNLELNLVIEDLLPSENYKTIGFLQ